MMEGIVEKGPVLGLIKMNISRGILGVLQKVWGLLALTSVTEMLYCCEKAKLGKHSASNGQILMRHERKGKMTLICLYCDNIIG